MKKIFEASLVFILSVIIFLIFFFWVLPSGLSNLNEYFFSTGSDGIKNYYTYLYYLKYDEGFHFTGMAYPFGDLITFTDNQPLLVLSLKFLESLGIPVQANAVLIFNILLLIGLPLSTLLFYTILRHFKIPQIHSFFIALAITFLNPQLERLVGHYALSYSFVLPLFWWFDIKLQLASVKKWWIVSIVITVLLLTYLHVYYLALAFLFFSFAGIGHLLAQGLTKLRIKNVAMLYLPLAILPMFIFKAFMFLVDGVTDRVAFPFGFLFYRTTYKSLFFNENSPFDHFFPGFLKVGKFEPEGKAYLGVFALFFCLYVLYTFVVKSKTTKKLNFSSVNITGDASFNPYIILALLALCIAAAFPFYMPPFDALVQFLTPLAQFRSPGRFAWIFYAIFAVFFHVYFYRIAAQSSNWVKYISIVIISIALLEGFWFARNTLKDLNKSKLATQFFDASLLNQLKEKQIDVAHYQAIVSFPFYTIGNEKESYSGTNESIFQSMKISFQTGLPLVNYMMSRTGIREGLNIMALASNPVLPKKYLNDIDSTKPFLLVCTAELLTENEKAILAISDSIFSFEHLQFYELSVASLKQMQTQKQFAIQHQNWIQLNKNTFTSDSSGQLLFFTSHISVQDLYINAAEKMNLNGSTSLYEGSLPSNDSVMVSCWARTKDEMYGFPVLKITEFNPSGEQVFHHNTHMDCNPEIYESTNLLKYTFKPQSAQNKVHIQIEGKRYNYSNVLIAKANSSYLFTDSLHNWYWNNFPLFGFSLK